MGFDHTTSTLQELTFSDCEHFTSFKLRSRMHFCPYMKLDPETWPTPKVFNVCVLTFYMSFIIFAYQQPSPRELALSTSLIKVKSSADCGVPAFSLHPATAMGIESELLWYALPQEKLNWVCETLNITEPEKGPRMQRFTPEVQAPSPLLELPNKSCL